MSEETSDIKCETLDASGISSLGADDGTDDQTFTKSPPAKKRKKYSNRQNRNSSNNDRYACSTCYLKALDIEDKDLPDQYRLLRVDAPAEKPCIVRIKNDNPDELKDWEETIGVGIATINQHSPGLCLVLENVRHPQIIIAAPKESETALKKRELKDDFKKCETKGNIHQSSGPAEIFLHPRIPKTIQPYVVVHELLHALGFEHENQRCDGRKYLSYPRAGRSLQPNDRYRSITPYDPFSIMHEAVGSEITRLRNSSLKGPPNHVLNEKMSELDKVALNMMYPPAISAIYPAEEADNGMYYCKRLSLINHNHPGESLIYECKPGGPNCPACRVLSPPKRMRDDQWQGRSGWVYCGKNGCGPHYGLPCGGCRKVVEI